MTGPTCDGYLVYDRLVSAMQDLSAGAPDLVTVSSIGKTYEGRDLWVMEITDRSTGPGDQKPGYYIDGNHHAVEVAGSAVCLYTARLLVEGYGSVWDITDLLGRTVFYILPRVAADGAELFLTTPHSLRSSTRPYPRTQPEPGLHAEDVDGDGRILEMRIPDADGEWKVSARDPRLMVRRLPGERGGRYYRLFPEGVMHGWDGGEIRVARGRWGLDLNRNYPALWVPESEQGGAGPFPLSEPESRAVADFVSSHPNIAGAMSYHTTGGYILRPSCHRPDAELPPQDLEAMIAIGWRGERITGYPCVSTFEGFTGRQQLKGVFMDWLYEHQGLIAFSTELWNAAARAGVDRRDRAPSPDEEEDDGVRLLAWNDRELSGRGHVSWYPVDHPQLGEVELGGWDLKYTLWNPPPGLLRGECHKNAMFTLAHAESLPRLAADIAPVHRLGERTYRIRVRVRNTGYLPTYVAGPGKGLDWVPAPSAVMDVPSDGELLHGDIRQEIGHLEGMVGTGRWGRGTGSRDKTLTWVLSTGQPQVAIRLCGGRAGNTALTVNLEDDT